jgi:hypothetical protein
MPMIYVEPEEVVRINNVTVYRAYKDDDASRPLTYWFSTYEPDNTDAHFDIRLIPGYTDGIAESEGQRDAFLANAVSKGWIVSFDPDDKDTYPDLYGDLSPAGRRKYNENPLSEEPLLF